MRSLALIIVFVALGVGAGTWFALRTDRAVEQAAASPPTAAVPCEADARCVGSRHAAAAAAACKAGIEDQARARVRWAHAAPGFDRFEWRDRERGIITFIGGEAEFENAAGAFLPVTYECDFEPVAARAVATRVR